MSLFLCVCRGCGASYFPARIRCPRCGSHGFDARPIEKATVTAVTRAARIPEGCDFAYLVELEASNCAPVIAAAAQRPVVGACVPVDQRADGAVFIPQIHHDENP